MPAGAPTAGPGSTGPCGTRRARQPQAGGQDHAPEGPDRPLPAALDQDDHLRSRDQGGRPAQAAFGPGTVELDRVYVSDITYIRTWEGWLYLATVIDLASRRVVGWSMADHMRTELVADALRMAVAARRPGPGLIFHSDRGTQYTSTEFTDLLAGHEIVQSLSRPRQCWDNAVAESFFSRLREFLGTGS
jgi:transposase InsO family protein